MVTGVINGQEVTVPAGTVILEAARMAGIEVPNLCFQPLMRAWGSCRICTVEILGKRLTWNAALVPSTGISYSYRVKPKRTGTRSRTAK